MKYRKAEAKEVARAQFRGLWAAITTPFAPGNRIDEAGLRRNMHQQVTAQEREQMKSDIERSGLLTNGAAARHPRAA